jgi:sugar/nucleoside kinase (ribokinase family)
VTVDLACGEPAFLDLTFSGLEALPAAGEERFAHELLRSPGGGATIAVGAARLGLTVALASPLGRDPDGAMLRAALEAEGIRCSARTVERTAVTAVMPFAGERAMASYQPEQDLRVADLEEHAPRAVVLSLARLGCAPAGAELYAIAGDEDARAFADGLPLGVGRARALILNTREALALTNATDASTAARVLSAHAPRVVVTCGRDGALSVADGELLEVPGIPVEAVDTTGAGDLFAAAFAWADLGGAPPRDCLGWACLYAALSVRVPTAMAGAVPIVTLAEAGAQHGLALPARYASVQFEEEAPQ